MIPLSSLQRLFDAATFSRGAVYQREGRVSALQAQRLTNGAIRLSATVRGSHRIPYAQRIQFQRGGNTLSALSGECDCPVGFNCKHVAAVLIEWVLSAAQPSTPTTTPTLTARRVPSDPEFTPPQAAVPALSPSLQALLSRLSDAAAVDGGDVYPETVRKRLLYVLRLDSGAGGAEAVVQPLSVSIRKDGAFGADEKPYGFEQIRTLTTVKFVTPSDRTILTSLAQNTMAMAGRRDEGSLLRGEWSGWLVERMLKTGRLHWQDFRANPPLRSGPTRRGTACWVADERGRQRFSIALDSPAALTLPTTPLLYVDRESGECGAVEADIRPHLAAALLSAPSLPPGEVAAFVAGVESLGLPLPTRPAAPTQTETRRVTPRPLLRLGQATRPYTPYAYGMTVSDKVAVAALGFDYAGRRVGLVEETGPLQRMEDGVLVTALRQPKAEAAASARLRRAGFVLNETPLTIGRGQSVRRSLFMSPTGPTGEFDETSHWLNFCFELLPDLRAEGWGIEIDADFPYQILDAPQSWTMEVGEGTGIDWFGLSLGIEVGGERVDLLPVLRSLIGVLGRLGDDEFADDGTETALDALAPDGVLFVRVGKDRFLPLKVERLRPMLGVLMELFGLQAPGADGPLRIGRTHLGDLAALEEAASAAGVPLLGADAVRGMARSLREAGGVPVVDLPDGLRATLRPYQRTGVNWLQLLAAHGFGGLLADDMGLGKTVQALAHLLIEKESGRMDRPCLLIAPTSVLGNWRSEAARFAPDLRTLVLHGPQRKAAHGDLADYDLVVTSYALLPRDRAVLEAQPWHLAIFDEAQYLKNPTSQATKATQALEARQRLCLTGTPVENNLDELWSLFSVAAPSLFGDRTGFRRLFRTPIEKHGDAERQRVLARRLRPFLLRRTKEEVASELPPKTEMVERVDPQAAQRDLYETIRLAMDQRVREEIARKGLARSHITILDALLKLRQVCCDPRLVKLESARKRVEKGASSAKLERLLELLPDLLADGRRILLFSQFTSMLDLIKPELARLGIPFVELTGDTRDRETPVRRFQAGEAPLFLISLKAGGTGLNLTAADTVIHYDPWWNPAVEDQATDRAHRIGQDKPVFVYKLVTVGTVEERMLTLQDRKRQLGEAVYDATTTEADLLTADDLDVLLAPIDG